jgi:hypothetical protein
VVIVNEYGAGVAIALLPKPIGPNWPNPVPPHSSHTHLLSSMLKKRKRLKRSQAAAISAPQPPAFSPPLAMQQSVWDSVVNGNFIDAKVFAFSRRAREPGRVDTPKALFVNTHVLATACGYFRSGTPLLSSKVSR